MAKDDLNIAVEQIEFDGELKYGDKDPLFSGAGREIIEAWEAKRAKNKIEYAFVVTPGGVPVGKEIRGGSGSVSVPERYDSTPGAVFSHIHPREPGILGGTFSSDDLQNFARGKYLTYRAVAKEGTYSISKRDKFDKVGFIRYVAAVNRTCETRASDFDQRARADVEAGKISADEYISAVARDTNSALIGVHNAYLQGAKKYGYMYTLEKR